MDELSAPASISEAVRAEADSLAAIAGVDAGVVRRLLSCIGTNAATIASEDGTPAGCAVSAHMGFTNHDCAPNCAAAIRRGRVAITALGDLAEGDELTISYVAAHLPYYERRRLLKEQYEFDCDCARCKADRKVELQRAKAKRR